MKKQVDKGKFRSSLGMPIAGNSHFSIYMHGLHAHAPLPRRPNKKITAVIGRLVFGEEVGPALAELLLLLLLLLLFCYNSFPPCCHVGTCETGVGCHSFVSSSSSKRASRRSVPC